MKKLAILLSFIVIISPLKSFAADVLVRDQDQFNAALKDVQPGDAVVLADGIWRDFEMLVEGKGTADAPITVRGQTPGKVILSGQSNLRLAGEHLVISDLVFKNGYTPTRAVVQFRKNKENLANNSRITNIVIDNYNNPERFEVDFWVLMYGKNNRFDHNHISGKKNVGVTMAVVLDTEASRENRHQIDHNYFGPRPVLGSNGGETLRVGTSHFSLTDSLTVIENNYFDRADGELEIVSIKSAGNIVRGNTFYESRGTMTLRHGNDNKVMDNVFFGNGIDHTGGIRVINANQTVSNNYMEGLTGYRFAGAFVVMNGVPDSPINRYHQVDNADMRNNTLVNSDFIQLGAGSDQERSAVPVNSTFEDNLIYHKKGGDLFTVYDDMSGINFAGNVMHMVKDPALDEGFDFQKIKMRRAENGLLYPVDEALAEKGVSRNLKVTKRADTGVDWYAKTPRPVAFGAGKTTKVARGENALSMAIAASEPGDVLVLDRGDFTATRTLEINHPLTIKGNSKRRKPVLDFERSALFQINDGGSLKLENIHLTGRAAPDNSGNSLIRTSRYAMLDNYRLEMVNVKIDDLDVNRAFDVLRVAKSTMADSIVLDRVDIKDVSGAVLKLNKETDNFGIFNADYVTIKNSRFENIGEEVVNLYRGGRDESTFGPHFLMQNSTIVNSSKGGRNKSGASVLLHGVQVADVENNTFTDSLPLKVEHTVSEPVTKIFGNKFVDSGAPSVEELNSDKENTAMMKNNSVVTTKEEAK